MTRIYTVNCLVCPRIFLTTSNQAQCCSPACRQALYRLRARRARLLDAQRVR